MDVKVSLSLTQNQIAKLKSGHKNNKPVSIRLSHSQLVNGGNHEVILKPLQHKAVLSAMKSKSQKGVQLTFSPEQTGGFLSALLGLLPTVVSGITNWTKGRNFFDSGSTGEGMKPLGSGLQPLGTQKGRGRVKKMSGNGMMPLGSGIPETTLITYPSKLKKKAQKLN